MTPRSQRARLESLRAALFTAAGVSTLGCSLAPLGGGGAGAAGTTTASGAGGSSASATSSSASSSTSSSSSSSSSSAGGTGGGGDAVCAGAKPVLGSHGEDTGLAQCPDGTVHRNHPAVCDATINAPACSGTEQTITCTSDADCTAGPHGRCVSTSTLEDAGVVTACGCHYACASDVECGAGDVCICGGAVSLGDSWSQCAPASCTSGADCASGHCGVSEYFDGCRMNVSLSCRAATDACHDDADCASGGGALKLCVLFATAPGDAPSWQCKGWTCVLGRPLLVEGATRTASPTTTRGWQSDGRGPAGARLAPLDLSGIDVSSLAADERERLARHFLDAAALEHASVASFARFTLELLALGAPRDLIVASHLAGLDVIEHATMAFEVASIVAGRDYGPGRLDVGGVAPRTSTDEIVRALVEEACVGETLGVVDAELAASDACGTALEGYFSRIAEDEARHAELAFRALGWILGASSEGEALRAAARDAFERCLARLEVPLPDRDDRLAPHGVSSSRRVAQARRDAARTVLRPLAVALLTSG